ncbi:MAG: hypothetical protein IT323_16320, partial [Anaerolineae bacterium]|nr:hypothetical protein [Anaerolineae bacterium]
MASQPSASPREHRSAPGRTVRTALLTVLALALIFGGGALAGWAVNQRGVETRGWADAASGEALPFRAPLPGVNVE